MTITYKETGLTEYEIINLPKVNKGCIYLGEEDVFLKKGKGNIINLGSKELFRDIHNIFNFDTSVEIHLFLALCGHEEVTDFRGDPYKTVEELVKGVADNKRYKYKAYMNSTREERKEYPLYWESGVIKIQSKSFIEDQIEKLENDSDLWAHEVRKLEQLKGIVNNLNNDILDILSQGKYELINSSITIDDKNLEKGSNEYYRELFYEIHNACRNMRPFNDNNSPFGLKVKYIRDRSTISDAWRLSNESSFDPKTGEVKIVTTDKLTIKEMTLNIYKDNISESEYSNKINIMVLLNTILKSYKKSNLDKGTIIRIIRQTLKHYNFNLSSWVRNPTNVYDHITDAGTEYIVEAGKGAPKNYLSVVTEIVKNIDRLNNLEEYKLFNEHVGLIQIPNKKKWKVHEVFNLTKQTYKKLLELNSYEQRNYLKFSSVLYKHFNHLYNEVNLHQLFDDTFLMVRYVFHVSHALELNQNVTDTIPISFANFKKMVHYLDVDAQDRQRIPEYALQGLYVDYLKDLAVLIREGYRTVESVNLTPFSLKLEHDIITDEKQSIQQQLDDKELKNKYESKLSKIINKTYSLKDGTKVKFLPADTVKKLKMEGKMLSHCVGGYANRIIKDKCLILLARLEEDLDNSWFTVEIRITDNGYVLGQQQSINEYKLPNELKKALEKDIKKINKEEFKDVA